MNEPTENLSTKQPWEFAGWGKATRVESLPLAAGSRHNLDQDHKSTLGKWSATAICGNDITSSCLYVSALCAAPQFFLQTNKWRGTNHWILAGFFFVCVTILMITSGEIKTLAGVYTLSFLSVMSLFALGNMLLKVRRSKLPRETRASWPAVVLAFVGVVIALLGNVILDPINVEIFGAYFLAVATVVAVMFLRIPILRGVLVVLRSMVNSIQGVSENLRTKVVDQINAINSNAMIYFTRGDDPAILNRAILYVLQNEQTTRLTVVYAYREESDIPSELAQHLNVLDRLYPQMRIDFIAVQGKFCPEMIDSLSELLHVPKNQMFIGTPGDRFPHRVESLGGVRIIL